jgi:hypothetical protein
VLDKGARKIGRSAVKHLKDMYPDSLAKFTKNAKDHVRNKINFHTKPLLDRLVNSAPSWPLQPGIQLDDTRIDLGPLSVTA